VVIDRIDWEKVFFSMPEAVAVVDAGAIHYISDITSVIGM